MDSLSPRHRRWRGLLDSLTLDPDALPRPLERPGERDFIICGLPRSGTTLAAAALFQPPRVVTAMEPWDGLRLPPAELFSSLRQEIATTGGLRRGRLDVEALSGGRVEWTGDGATFTPLDLEDDYSLGVKWPAFWRYLDLLPTTRFVLCVRDPIATVASFKNKGGRLGEGLEYDIPFHREMNDELTARSEGSAARRVHLYEYIARRAAEHVGKPNVFVLHYERWFSDQRGIVADLSAFLDIELETIPARVERTSRDPSDLLDRTELDLISSVCSSARAFGYEPAPTS